MITLLIAVFVASLLGSFHCVCMCGPIAIWTNGGQSQKTRTEIAKRMVGYHLGRLFTYLVLGTVAGLIGQSIGLIGQGAGIQSAAARLAGGLLIVMGAWRLASMWAAKTRSTGNSATGTQVAPWTAWGQRITGRIAKTIAMTRPKLMSLPLTLRSIALGAITVLLPCGWLYLFVLFAAGSGSVLSALGVMTAFWLGTIPSLMALVMGALRLQTASRQTLPRLMPFIGAVVLILFGIHTATGRASADFKQWEERVRATLTSDANTAATHETFETNKLDEILEQPLPCCQHVK
jgi:sulfite exporter TauE/SafE